MPHASRPRGSMNGIARVDAPLVERMQHGSALRWSRPMRLEGVTLAVPHADKRPCLASKPGDPDREDPVKDSTTIAGRCVPNGAAFVVTIGGSCKPMERVLHRAAKELVETLGMQGRRPVPACGLPALAPPGTVWPGTGSCYIRQVVAQGPTGQPRAEHTVLPAA